MDAEHARSFLLKLPHVCETMQWGDNLVFWVGDKALGGKMFALLSLDARGLLISFAAGPERAAELCEREGLRPAPYFARIHWVAAEAWDALPRREWETVLQAAYEMTLAKLPKRTRETLALPAKAYAALLAERRKILAEQGAAGKSEKAKKSPGRQAKVQLRAARKQTGPSRPPFEEL